MNRNLFGLAFAAGVLAVAGCASDPTGDLSGEPARVVSSLDRVFLFPGDSTLVTAELRDAQGIPLATLPDVAAADPAISTVTEADAPPLSQRRFYVKGVNPGFGRVLVTFGDFVDTISTVVFPTTFDGAIAVATSGHLDTVTIQASALIGFDTAGSTTVTIDDVPTLLVSRTATEIKVLPLSIDPLPGAIVTLHDVVFLPGTEDIEMDEIPAAQAVDISGEDNEPGNDAADGAGPITINLEVAGVVTSSDIDDHFVFTLAAPASVTITTVFEGAGGDPDIDVFLLNATGGGFCVLDGCRMATGANPEQTTSTAILPAGTYTILVELFDIGDADEPTWYRVIIQ